MYSVHIFLYELYDLCLIDRLEDIGAAAREESVDHREARILCRRSDECHDPFLHPWEEDILLGFAPSVYLIEEEDRLATFLVVFLCFCDDPYDIFFLREYSRQVKKLCIQ